MSSETKLRGPVFNFRDGTALVRWQYRTPAITDTSTRFARVIASEQAPVFIAAQVYVHTVDATETISVGTLASATSLINAASLANADVFLPANNAVGKLRITADTDLYYVGSAGSDTGIVDIILDFTTLNNSTVTGL